MEWNALRDLVLDKTIYWVVDRLIVFVYIHHFGLRFWCLDGLLLALLTIEDGRSDGSLRFGGHDNIFHIEKG